VEPGLDGPLAGTGARGDLRGRQLGDVAQDDRDAMVGVERRQSVMEDVALEESGEGA
jgi:hypothetical protein